MAFCATIKKFFRPHLTRYVKHWRGEYFREDRFYVRMYEGSLSIEAAEKAFNKRLVREYKRL